MKNQTDKTIKTGIVLIFVLQVLIYTTLVILSNSYFQSQRQKHNVESPHITRYYSRDSDVVCWNINDVGLSCLPRKDTNLTIEELLGDLVETESY